MRVWTSGGVWLSQTSGRVGSASMVVSLVGSSPAPYAACVPNPRAKSRAPRSPRKCIAEPSGEVYSLALVSPYLRLIAAEFRRQSAYRLALAAGIFTNGSFGLIRAGVLLGAVAGAGGSVGGYDARSALLYVLWGQALLGAIPMWGWNDIADRVRTGEIAVDLARPMDLQTYWWFRDIGRAAMQFLGRGLPILVLGSIVLRVPPPSDPLVHLAGIIGLL